MFLIRVGTKFCRKIDNRGNMTVRAACI